MSANMQGRVSGAWGHCHVVGRTLEESHKHRSQKTGPHFLSRILTCYFLSPFPVFRGKKGAGPKALGVYLVVAS